MAAPRPDLATRPLQTHEPQEPEALRSGIPKGERSRACGSAGAHDPATGPPQTHEPQEPEALRSGIPKGERSRVSGSAGPHDPATGQQACVPTPPELPLAPMNQP
jgi:hypothetical protein